MKKRRQSLTTHPAIRILIIWVIQALALLILTFLLSGLWVDNLAVAFIAAAVIGLLNALLWPLLSYILLPFAVLTLGLLTLVLNGAVIWLAGQFVDGFHVDSLWTAILAALGLTLLNTIASALLTIDDDNSWSRNVVRRRMKRMAKPEETDVPGVLFLEIDGLARPVLERAIGKGYAPNLARWLQEGSHRLVSWECDLSSQTSASQAGILHGSNHNIPAFRWWDRQHKKLVASSSPDDVARLEEERSDGNGLLADNGASRGNMFSGDAPNVMNTASTIKDLSRFHTTDFYAFFLDPYNFSRTLLLTIWDIILEKVQFWQARRKDTQPRLGKDKRGGIYPLLRAFTTVLMRELNIQTLIGDMFAGVPSAYATFVGYDEVAHHSGVESEDAFDALDKLDQQLGRLASAAKQAPRPYHLVFLSDHGQSAGATFKQRYHMTLEDLVQQLLQEYRVEGAPDVHEDWKHVNVFLTEAIQSQSKAVSRPLGQALRRKTVDGQVAVGPEAAAGDAAAGESADRAPIIVLASGNLGLVYSTRLDERATLEEIETLYPGLLEGLAAHEGIGFLMVRSREQGAVVIGAGGRTYLANDRVEGENPLAGFGPNAADHLRRTDGFPDAPDILVNSFYRVETNEVAAFEELIGSHGGLGGFQTQPFVLFPAEWQVEEGDLVGAAAVYRQFKDWLDRLQTPDRS
ncbi:MAG: phage holin family protein [Anaerolineae bacterium]|nr:phage holin family protein [Anaerolineae bacterium]